MKKNLKIILICITVIIIVLAIVLLGIPKYNEIRREQIIRTHLHDINNCIKAHHTDGDIEVIKNNCTEGFLYIFEKTRKPIDYNILAEQLKYDYTTYVDEDNKDLINAVINRYPSLSSNIKGLNNDKGEK